MEVNDKSFVIAMGIDKGKNDLLKVSFLFTAPDSGGAEDSGEKEKSKDIVTVEAPTVYSALRLINTFKSKKIDISHTKLIIFSEEIAKKGINGYVTDFVNTRGFRPSIYLCVCQSDAEDFFNSIEPKQDIFIERYIEHLFGKVTNNSVNEAYLYNAYFNMCAASGGAILPLVGISEKDAPDKAENIFENVLPDDFSINYTAEEIPIEGKKSAVLCGYAAFSRGKMTGELGFMESELVRMVKKNMPSGEFSVFYPDKGEYISINLRQNSAPSIKVRTGGQAEIDIDVLLWCEFTGVSSLSSSSDYSGFIDYVNSVFTQKLSKLMERTQTEFRADVLNLGSFGKQNFLTNSSWSSYGWDEKYPSALIVPSVTIIMDDFGEIRRSPKKSDG